MHLSLCPKRAPPPASLLSEAEHSAPCLGRAPGALEQERAPAGAPVLVGVLRDQPSTCRAPIVPQLTIVPCSWGSIENVGLYFTKWQTTDFTMMCVKLSLKVLSLQC